MTARTNLPALVVEAPLTPQPPVLVLFGRDRGGKPRAAWFDGNQAEAAKAAADTMKLRALPIEGEEPCALAIQLAHGRILPSGKAHVPGARPDLYGRLVALAGECAGLSLAEAGPDAGSAPDPTTPKVIAPGGLDQPAPTVAPVAPVAPPRPSSEADKPIAASLGVDSAPKPRPGDRNFVGTPKPRERDEIGLGSLVLAHEGPEDGWWEAEVIGINGQVFSLRWRDYPLQATILRKAGELAMLPPGGA
ncbi:hypothetical protein MKK58_08015 [Methylobacterium sp. J-078]|uniref:hypothetical protein n=1 Tax=Methylobacterium sp. J-078 TaxID=2836657 RepID=UPI001FB963EE|nr:hypothetical protein [Methylobacterium sp. J-078]MCJ2044477.1 hypothetical protein [Methylobacterium sp. J-078]